jgi:hypothetical protein
MVMLDIKNPTVWLIGVLALGILAFAGRTRFSPEARARRRREKSHKRIVSRKQGPSVRLAVNTERPDRDRKD